MDGRQELENFGRLLREARRARGVGLRLRAAWGFGRVWLRQLLASLFFLQSGKRVGRNGETGMTVFRRRQAMALTRLAKSNKRAQPWYGERARGKGERAAGQTPDEAELLHGDGGSRYLW